MIRPLVLFACLALLAGCGADGEPVTPTGAVSVGVGSGGVTTSATAGVRSGNVSVRVGI